MDACLCACLCLCEYVCILTYVCISAGVYKWMFRQVDVCMCLYVCMFMCVHVYSDDGTAAVVSVCAQIGKCAWRPEVDSSYCSACSENHSDFICDGFILCSKTRSACLLSCHWWNWKHDRDHNILHYYVYFGD